jgi:hypothetical protein
MMHKLMQQHRLPHVIAGIDVVADGERFMLHT